MRVKSPQRNRRIRNAALVGALVGALIGYVGTAITGRYWYVLLFATITCFMSAMATSLTQSDYDFD